MFYRLAHWAETYGWLQCWVALNETTHPKVRSFIGWNIAQQQEMANNEVAKWPTKTATDDLCNDVVFSFINCQEDNRCLHDVTSMDYIYIYIYIFAIRQQTITQTERHRDRQTANSMNRNTNTSQY